MKQQIGAIMRYISDLREGDMINEIYLCKNKQVAKTKAGKSYYSMILQDKTGVIDSKVWDLSNGISHFDDMDYIQVDAQVTSFQGNNQLNVKRVRIAQEGEYLIEDYMPCTDKNVDELYTELLRLVGRVKDIYLRKLLDNFFVEDKTFVKRFKEHSAAKTVHHGFMGGLLEHTVAVARMCEFIADNYSLINSDLLITAALFHDMGKLDEISDFPKNDYTDEGQLVGHIVMGAILLDRKISEIPEFPVKMANELKHCILSHHGELEYGSPKKPALIEAVALSFADNTDAKLQTFTELLNNSSEDKDWIGYNKFLESNVRKSSKSVIK